MSMFLHVMFIKSPVKSCLKGNCRLKIFVSVDRGFVWEGKESNVCGSVCGKRERACNWGRKKQRRSLKRAETRKQKTFIEGRHI